MPGKVVDEGTDLLAVYDLDVLVQLAVLDRSLAAPPRSPAEGARYIVAAATIRPARPPTAMISTKTVWNSA